MATILIGYYKRSFSILKSLSATLKKRGFKINTVNDGNEVTAELRHNPGRYNLLLMEGMMPELAGFEVVLQLRQDSSLKAVPAVVLIPQNNERESDRLWKSRPLPFLWGDEEWEWAKHANDPYTVYVYRNDASGIQSAIAAVLKRYPPN